MSMIIETENEVKAKATLDDTTYELIQGAIILTKSLLAEPSVREGLKRDFELLATMHCNEAIGLSDPGDSVAEDAASLKEHLLKAWT